MNTAPSILLIMTDQQRWDSLGCYGAGWVQTQHLDGLARDGVLFERCYATNPVCTPSRASLMTGKHLPGHGVYALHDILPAEEVLFTRRLQERGYRTALFGKLHVSGRIYEAESRHPQDGFDVYEWCLEAPVSMDSPFNGYSTWLKERDASFHERLRREGRKVLHIPRELHLTHWAAERTIDFIRQADSRRPFFCKMSVFDPHNPYEQYPLEMNRLVDQAAIPAPVPPPPGPRPAAIRREAEHSYLGAFSRFTAADIRKMRQGYYAMIAFIDLEVGRVLQALKERGLEENTLVIFCSDHGDLLGDHGLLVKGAFFYDPCVRVPLLVRWPAGALSAGLRVSAPVQLHDLAATILAAAGASAEALAGWMPEARDLGPLMRGEAGAVREHTVCLYRNSGICDTGRVWDPPIHASMILDARHKLCVYHAAEGSSSGLEGQLFDLQEDPLEQRDLWAGRRHAAARRELTEALLEWLHAVERGQGGRGGTATPAPSQQLVNALK
jgi:arylsulfatase